jgi:dolichol-phosphate mannosyltransferase
MILEHRSDVVGTSTYPAAWRLEKLPEDNLRAVDLLVESNLDNLLEDVKPRTIFNCVGYGAYSFQQESELIYETNFNLTAKLLQKLALRKIACYVHAGSSSEYGDRASGPFRSLPAQICFTTTAGRKNCPALISVCTRYTDPWRIRRV